MKQIHNEQEFNTAIQNDKISVILFTTKWCGDCMFIKPFMPSVEAAYDAYDFYEIDRDEMMDLRKTRPEIEAYLDVLKDVEE